MSVPVGIGKLDENADAAGGTPVVLANIKVDVGTEDLRMDTNEYVDDVEIAGVLSFDGLAGKVSCMGLEIGLELASLYVVALVLCLSELTTEVAMITLDIGVEVTAVDTEVAVVLSQFGFAREVVAVRLDIEVDGDTEDGVEVVLSLSENADEVAAVEAADHGEVEVDSIGSTKTVVTATEAVNDEVSVVFSHFRSVVDVGVVGGVVMLMIDIFEQTETQASSYAVRCQC